ncbi:MAG TPA: NPCBM/NEW2 domain-containing protein [Thermoguttaceae bacterium]|nr:NPCBM/NEW2 domain-containing protein [Thermoguttaceae bacterium]
MSTFLAVLVMFAATQPTASGDAEIRCLDGRVVEGTVLELSDKQLTLQTSEGRVSFDTDELLGIFPKQAAASKQPTDATTVGLVDGSILVADRYTVTDRQAEVTFADERILDLPNSAVAAVRFLATGPATADEWPRLTELQTDTDLLVVGDAQGINYHRGVILDVTDTTVQFELDGTLLPVKRAKVFGLIYHRPPNNERSAAVCRITGTNGSQWSAHLITLDGNLRWTTPSGVATDCPPTAIRSIDFSQGKIVFLSDLKPESTEFTPYFGGSEGTPLLESLYALRTDTNLELDPLSLDKQAYRKGLALHSRMEVVYRLPDRFRRFKAVAGIDDAVRPHGDVRLVLSGDDRILFEATVTGSDPPTAIDLDLTGVRRLKIFVDFGQNMDVADHLDLCEARVIK